MQLDKNVGIKKKYKFYSVVLGEGEVNVKWVLFNNWLPMSLFIDNILEN